jgi:hypothetical protein
VTVTSKIVTELLAAPPSSHRRAPALSKDVNFSIYVLAMRENRSMLYCPAGKKENVTKLAGTIKAGQSKKYRIRWSQ